MKPTAGYLRRSPTTRPTVERLAPLEYARPVRAVPASLGKPRGRLGLASLVLDATGKGRTTSHLNRPCALRVPVCQHRGVSLNDYLLVDIWIFEKLRIARGSSESGCPSQVLKF